MQEIAIVCFACWVNISQIKAGRVALIVALEHFKTTYSNQAA